MIGHYYIHVHCTIELLNFLKFQSTIYCPDRTLMYLTILVLVLYLDPPKLVHQVTCAIFF